MVKRELIDRKRVIDVVINKGTNWKDILNLLNTSTEIPIYTEQEIIEPYLEKLKAEIAVEEREEDFMNDYSAGWNSCLNTVISKIDNLLSESEE